MENTKYQKLVDSMIIFEDEGLPMVVKSFKSSSDFGNLIPGDELSITITENGTINGIPICFKFTNQDEYAIYGESINYELLQAKKENRWNGNPVNTHRIMKQYIIELRVIKKSPFTYFPKGLKQYYLFQNG